MDWEQEIQRLLVQEKQLDQRVNELQKAERIANEYLKRINFRGGGASKTSGGASKTSGGASKTPPKPSGGGGGGGESKGGEAPIPAQPVEYKNKRDKWFDENMPPSWSGRKGIKDIWDALELKDKKDAFEIYNLRVDLENDYKRLSIQFPFNRVNIRNVATLQRAQTLWKLFDPKDTGFVNKPKVLKAVKKNDRAAQFITNNANQRRFKFEGTFLEKEENKELRSRLIKKFQDIDTMPKDTFISYDEFIIYYCNGNYTF